MATAVLSGNRNFDGRIHPYAKQAFLASPPLVVAYAIAGTIRFDIEKDVLTVFEGREIRLADLWPDRHRDRRHRRQERQARALPPGLRADVRDPRRLARARRPAVRLACGRAPTSAVRRTGKARWPESARCAACARWPLLPDNITTDHLSPSNAIMRDSAAGEYLHRMGVPEEDFNSYATHRGDHLTAQRATFANPTLNNEMVRNADGRVRRARSRAWSPTAR